MRLVFAGLWAAIFLFSQLALADTGLDIEKRIFSECGIASALLVIAVIYLATANAKTRSAWEADRLQMAASYEKLATSYARLEGIVVTLRASRRGHD